ncbi:hypothetical protein PIROE2DRAFT_10417 [Piromyces sp. E2]|nr:hypothetical protein PIROE2DRAFT_10417 [Piromyces sp. E2]|eukprot:OUM63109.1 hypothetical protein PIROE2DRAFT_10417 [Piromyces sp. E2]
MLKLFYILYTIYILAYNVYADNIYFEFNGSLYLDSLLNDSDKKPFNLSKLNFYENKSTRYTTDEIVESLLEYTNTFIGYNNEEKLSIVRAHEETYKSAIQLLVTSLLNRWYLTEQEEFNSKDIYVRNTLLITLEAFLDVDSDTDIYIGNITIKELKDIINILSSSLYYDNNIISINYYNENADILDYPAYSAIGRGYDIPDDYEKYNAIMNDYINNNKISTTCPYGFDHKLSLIMLGLCDKNTFMIKNTNKYNLLNLYKNGEESFVTSDRFIYATQNAFQYYSTASMLVLNKYRFSDYVSLNRKDNLIIKELFTLYDIEEFLYKIKKYDSPKILPYNIYFRNEFSSVTSNATSKFQTYSAIMEIIYNEIKKKGLTDEFNDVIVSLKDILESIAADVYNADDVDEYNNIVRMYNNLFVSKELLNYSDNTDNVFNVNNYYIESKPNYYPENQLSDELRVLSKYYKSSIKINNNGKLTTNINSIIRNISKSYQYDNDSDYVHGTSIYEFALDFSNIVNDKSLTNYYGDYYSDNINKYADIVNTSFQSIGMDQIYDEVFDTSGEPTSLYTASSFTYLTSVIDTKYMVYNINFITNKIIQNDDDTADVQLRKVNMEIEKCTDDDYKKNKLYFIYNVITSSINKRGTLEYKRYSIEIPELDEYIKKLVDNNYKINYSYDDVVKLNHLKYYLYNQSPFTRDSNIIELIRNVDESFVINMNLYNIRDALTDVRIDVLSKEVIYDLLYQSYGQEKKSAIRKFIFLIDSKNIDITDLYKYINKKKN